MAQRIFEAVIGLEIHAQLMTKTKVFCTSSVDTDALPNSSVGVVSAGQPGALPVLNKEVLRLAAKAAIALNCHINDKAIFERKNYFYPDLPKGYQISQLSWPIGTHGHVDIYGKSSEKITIGIDRIQIEEDAGKLTHAGTTTWVDLNRAGTPLVEIVSKPEIRTPAQAAQYMRTVYNLLVFAEVCDGNLEKGNFRCDANVSIRLVGDKELRTRTEIKNVNSFRFVEKAIDFEIARQIALVEAGGKVVQETRGWDSGTSTTYTMRIKEDAQDYRYFPDPDLPPVLITNEWIENIKKSMPLLPHQITAELERTYCIDGGLAKTIGADPKIYYFFKSLVDEHSVNSMELARLICGDISYELKKIQSDIDQIPFSKKSLVQLLGLISAQKISSQVAKRVLKAMFEHPELDPIRYVHSQDLFQVSDAQTIRVWIDTILQQHANPVLMFKGGDLKVFDFLQGQVMKASKGKANPVMVSELLREVLKS